MLENKPVRDCISVRQLLENLLNILKTAKCCTIEQYWSKLSSPVELKQANYPNEIRIGI